MRVLVTGASGFVGRALVDALAGALTEVRAAVRRLPSFRFPPGVDVRLHGDLALPIDWTPLLGEVDAVVHLAGIAHVGADIAEAVYDRVNHLATAELAAAAQKAGVKHFVFISSVRAQSGPTADHPLRETDAPQPSDAYGRSKLAAERAVRACGVPFTVLRPVLIYGAGVKGNFAANARLASTPLPQPFGSFENKRSLLSCENLIEAIRFTLATATARGETYLVADGEPVSPADIITALRKGRGRSPGLLHVPPPLVRSALSLVGRASMWERLGGQLVVDVGKLMSAGWQPRADTRAQLAQMAEAGVR